MNVAPDVSRERQNEGTPTQQQSSRFNAEPRVYTYCTVCTVDCTVCIGIIVLDLVLDQGQHVFVYRCGCSGRAEFLGTGTCMYGIEWASEGSRPRRARPRTTSTGGTIAVRTSRPSNNVWYALPHAHGSPPNRTLPVGVCARGLRYR
eukprot:COSAG02_NODE_3882_length_6090_cov_26.657152_2_plen_147_part_00